MAYESLYLGVGLGTLAAAITFRYLRYKSLKGGVIYERVRYPEEDNKQGLQGDARLSIPDSSEFREQSLNAGIDEQRGTMETLYSQFPTTANGESRQNSNNTRRDKLRRRIRKKD